MWRQKQQTMKADCHICIYQIEDGIVREKLSCCKKCNSSKEVIMKKIGNSDLFIGV